MSDITKCNCGDCGATLDLSCTNPEKEKTPCPDCGSLKRHLYLELHDEFAVKVRDTLQGKLKDPRQPSKRKVRREFFYGADERRSKGDYVYKEREIDRDNDLYRELVKDEETGEILHEVEEPLSDHFGHGTAKFKALLPPDDNDDKS